MNKDHPWAIAHEGIPGIIVPDPGVPTCTCEYLPGFGVDAAGCQMHLSDPSWTEDAEGYLVAPLENRGTLDAG